jgi:putative ABC transport system permease protein
VRLVSAVAVLLRRLRMERGIAVALVVLVAVTSFVVAISPRLFERVADEGLRYEVDRGTAVQRNLQFTSVDHIRAGEKEPMEVVRSRGETRFERLPASVRDVIDTRDFVVESPRFGLTDPPNYRSFVTLRYQDLVADRLTIREGRAPADLEQGSEDDQATFEIALSTETAEELLVGVDDVLSTTPDPSDPMLRLMFPRPMAQVDLLVVGLFTVDEPDDPAWFDDVPYARAAIGGTDEAPIAFATALFAPEAYSDVVALGLPGRYQWRFHVDAGRLDAGRLEMLVPDLRRLDSTFGTNRSTAGAVLYRSGLPEIIDRYLERRAASEAVLSVAAIGPLAVAAGALGLVAAIVIRRRRAALALARGRGASAGQLLAAQLWEGLLLTVPAAAAGLIVARLAVPARSDPVSATGAVLVALAVTALLLLVTWPRARRARQDVEREDLPARRLRPRRIVFEATFIGVALAAVWLLRERGLRAGPASGFDPFLAAAPVLIGVAIALLTIRLYPLPVGALAWLGARRRDLIPALGLRSIGRDPAAATMPLLVITLTVAIAVFASVLALTIDRGQVTASWQQTGADYRLDAPTDRGFAAGTAPASVPGVEAVAGALVTPTPRIIGDTDRSATTTFVAVDPTAYAKVLAGAPTPLPIPPAFATAPTTPDAGTPDRPIPVVISQRLPAGWPPLAPGETFEVSVRGEAFSLTVAGVADDLPGLPHSVPFILAPFASVASGWDGPPLRPTVFYVRGAEALAADLRATVGGSGEVTSRHESLAAQRGAPLVGAIGRGFGIAVTAAAIYAALAIVAVVFLEGQRRARELAYLRTLGLTGGQTVSLTFVEHAPPTVLALAVGVVLGLGVAWLLEPGLGLGAFIGPAAPVRLQVDWPAIAAIAVIGIVAISVMVGASSWLARRLEPSRALRIGDV